MDDLELGTFVYHKARVQNAGLAVGDCVITEYGVMVGQITEVGSTWATVATVIDLNTNIGASYPKNGASGLLCRRFCHDAGGLWKLSYLAGRSAGVLGRHGHDLGLRRRFSAGARCRNDKLGKKRRPEVR